jgi:hypothetical protein
LDHGPKRPRVGIRLRSISKTLSGEAAVITSEIHFEGLVLAAAQSAAPASEVWILDRLDQIGGHPTTILGNPRVIDTPLGKAIEFDGVDDAIFLDVHPLAGAETFTCSENTEIWFGSIGRIPSHFAGAIRRWSAPITRQI